MRTSKIRQEFLDFFAARGHELVPSSSLVPANDPTLLFTNAGMVQFKDVFLGREQRAYVRAASAQRCVRAGGKHNDLENVGYTARHHTFFEMLGNFSFGDYFKRDAILYAWELLTKVYKLPPDKLWVTVYQTDDEAYDIWANDVRVPLERIVRVGDKPGGKQYESDNFWQMADTGPCGPCSEIFYDHGPGITGGPPGSAEEEGDRYIEIWNLVFMQFDRDESGNMNPLPKPCVDTGMGLERLAAVLQGVHSNYEIDLFRNLINAAAEVTGCDDHDSPSLKVIADHIRACAFLITDGVLPSNEGRGYVLRRIIRRAVRHGYMLGMQEPFFHKLVVPLDKEMGKAYPELHKARAQVEKALLQEERRFAETLYQGMGLLEAALDGLKGKRVPGETVFKLYDTFGFPVDLTADIARERGLQLDMEGFEREMAKQRERARAASRFEADYGRDIEVNDETQFTGYENLQGQAEVVRLFRGSETVTALEAGDEAMVILDNSPFYAESGGQIGDTGRLTAKGMCFTVHDAQKYGNAIAHIGRLDSGTLKTGDKVSAEVDQERRQAIVLNHSATHLLHAALRKVLGKHVTQKGSLVAPDRLRFDFSHPAPVTDDELRQVEDLVNAEIRRNVAAVVSHVGYDEAIAAGAMALFGEKYGDVVRVMRFGDFSTELCGGTHVGRTGDIGLFMIISEGGVASGVRRIEAVTGSGALARVRDEQALLKRLADEVKADRGNVEQRVSQLAARNRTLEKELADLRSRLTAGQGTDLAGQAEDIGGLKVLAARLDGADAKALREAVDRFKHKLGHAAVVLGAVNGGKVQLVAGVTKDATASIKAGDLLAMVAGQVGGKGGGRADMAQGGGTEPDKLDGALASVHDWVRQQLG